MSKLKGRITIGRPNCGNGSEYISIKVKDELSRTRFLDIEIGYSDFSQLLTGLSEVECSMITRDLSTVGMKVIKRDFSFEMPKTEYGKRHDVASELAIKNAPDGWTPSLYWGSKTSFRVDDNGTEWAHTTASKWVDPEAQIS